MERPVIGVTPHWDEDRDSLLLKPGYLEGIMKAGGLPFILPFTKDEETLGQLAGVCAGFLFTGGQDICPDLYGADKLSFCGPVCAKRDAMEKALFSITVLKQNKPAFGICRGIQLFNTLLGGTLYQDLPAQLRESRLTHQQEPPYDRPVHRVSIEPGSPLHALLGVDTLAVNSCHHQGIAELAPPLTPMAWAEDGLVEAVYMKDRPFVRAVQWHPEKALADEHSGKLFDAFVDACRQTGNPAP
jgi:putative glutamine amidotransferase